MGQGSSYSPTLGSAQPPSKTHSAFNVDEDEDEDYFSLFTTCLLAIFDFFWRNTIGYRAEFDRAYTHYLRLVVEHDTLDQTCTRLLGERNATSTNARLFWEEKKRLEMKLSDALVECEDLRVSNSWLRSENEVLRRGCAEVGDSYSHSTPHTFQLPSPPSSTSGKIRRSPLLRTPSIRLSGSRQSSSPDRFSPPSSYPYYRPPTVDTYEPSSRRSIPSGHWK